MIRKITLTLFMVFLSALSFAKEITISVDAPRVIAVGAPFRIEFSLNGKPDSFKAPDFEGFDIVAGPSTSQSTSISIINGKTKKTSTYVYTYVLVAREAGNMTIKPAIVEDDDMVKKTKIINIEVVKEQGNNSNNSGTSTASRKTQGIAKDDIILLVSTNKKNVYEGEPILAKIKILTRAELVNISSAKYPSFEGFWTQDLNIKQDNEWQREVYNNKIYDSKVIREYMLFPQKKGTITIGAMSMDFVARLQIAGAQNNSGSVFDDFFGGGGRYQNITRKVVSPKVNIKVKPFNKKAPESYNGAVGKFTISSQLSEDIISANNSSNLKLTIKGTGNLPLINEPKIEFPSSFELYKVKTTDNLNTNSKGVSGSKVFEFPFIARAKGEYEIKPITFSYFDVKKQDYVTLTTEPIKIAVTADTTSNYSQQQGTTIISGLNKDELKILGSDIRYIKTGSSRLKPTNRITICRFSYYAILALLIGLFVAGVIFFRKHIKSSKDVVKQKNKKASRSALKRLREAKNSMGEKTRTLFYQNILKAMWGYIGDKLNIENSKLTKDNISDKLRELNIDDDIINMFKEVIAQAEEAQYAPKMSEDMEKLYQKALNVISNIDNKL